ncbi:hypothetical protein PR202_gb01036 [Eleusine coracana subsp. coracana]|uniref:Uncharacterized protein n=1 Tax=Eleusine coracana subsp. coracana TaxID=191504 RepID=A0AAV5DUL0_ELECO|nr:hypothetical protein PR202_gb01036 [Eleusine coracana subsp. coracana]
MDGQMVVDKRSAYSVKVLVDFSSQEYYNRVANSLCNKEQSAIISSFAEQKAMWRRPPKKYEGSHLWFLECGLSRSWGIINIGLSWAVSSSRMKTLRFCFWSNEVFWIPSGALQVGALAVIPAGYTWGCKKKARAFSASPSSTRAARSFSSVDLAPRAPVVVRWWGFAGRVALAAKGPPAGTMG